MHRGDFHAARQVRGPPRQERRQPIGGVVAEPGFGGVDDVAGGFPGFGAGEAADDPLRGGCVAAEKPGGDDVFGEIEEGGEGWGLGQAGQAVPLGMGRISGLASPVSGAKASAELVVPRSIPMEKRARAIRGDSLGLRESGTLGAGSQCGGRWVANGCGDARNVARRWGGGLSQRHVRRRPFEDHPVGARGRGNGVARD